jgi:hypothetical protein
VVVLRDGDVGHGARCVVRGTWCVVRGAWCVVRGACVGSRVMIWWCIVFSVDTVP